MERLLARIQDEMAGLDAEYADLRYGEVERSYIRTKNGAPEEIRETVSRGVGFRVLAGGAFGFSATGDLTEKSLRRHLQKAHQMARSFSRIRHTEVKLVPVEPVKERWVMPVQKDPWKLSFKEKTAPFFAAEKELIRHPGVDSASSVLDCTRKKTVFISSEGSWIDQTLYRTGGWISGEAWVEPHRKVNGTGREKIRRSWPGPSGAFRAQGFEALEEMKFEEEVPRLAGELAELRQSPGPPAGTFDLILKGSILALQIHETFGHASESDRVYGYEDNYGGRTFLNPGLLAGLPVASPAVTIVSDADPKGGAGSFCFDDEGVPHRRVEIIQKGIFTDYLTSRETAFFLNRPHPSANMVARDWSHYPIIRMTNTSLMPGEGTLAELISGVEEGFLLDNEFSWSIDEMRFGFQIGAECGRRIEKGKTKGLVRFPVYHGNTIDFWRSCDRVAGRGEWGFWGFADCGKGGPYQEAFTGHGLAPARFRGVRFGRE